MVVDEPLISIIDDDAGVRTSLDALIRASGYRVRLFNSAEAYLHAADGLTSDCVISDVHMPGGMSGIDLIKAIHATRRHVPVILISAFANALSEAEAAQVGAACTLRKPFNGDELIACIAHALRGG